MRVTVQYGPETKHEVKMKGRETRVSAPNIAPPATYSVDEAAAVLGIGRGSAYEAIAQGKIPHLRFGRKIVVPRAALERLLSEAPQG